MASVCVTEPSRSLEKLLRSKGYISMVVIDKPINECVNLDVLYNR